MGLLLFFFFLSIAFSFLCSVLEAVLLSVTPRFIQQQVTKGTATGKLLSEYKEDIDRPLSAILTLNTIAHTVGAIGVGAQAGNVFDTNFTFLGIGYESIVATVMTLAILILSEIIPKTIGANNWKRLSHFTVQTLRVLLFILAPLVWVSQLITKSLKKDKEKSVLSRSDITAIAKEGEASGALDATESTIISNLLNFEKKKVKDIMTPRKVVFMLKEDLTLKEYSELEYSSAFSRVPVFNEDKDDVTGLVLRDELLDALSKDETVHLKSFKREVKMIHYESTLPELFERMTDERNHLYLAVDDFGQMQGVITMEDVFETLLGKEITDETDVIEDLQGQAKKLWEKRRTQ
jgi:CBS domain containing-hemolysin-like protein